jgi:cytochrome c
MNPRTSLKAVAISSLVAALFLISACDSGRDETARRDTPTASKDAATTGGQPAASQGQSGAPPAADQKASSAPSASTGGAAGGTGAGAQPGAATDATTAGAATGTAAGSPGSSSGATQVAAAGDPGAMIKKYNCVACHTIDKKLVGPAYKEVAAKYKGEAGAADKLVEKVKKGGSGVWGAIPMPPNPTVPDGDVRAMVDWILAGAN